MIRTMLVMVVGAAALGCTHTMPPPQELTDARVAYVRASRGPAARLSAPRLALARQTLDEAEKAYANADEREVRDRSYVALRRIQGAESDAAATLAGQRRWKAMHDLAILKDASTDKARTEAAEAREQRETAEARAQQALSEIERAGNVRRDDRGLVVTLSGQVLFPSDEATLLPAAQRSLEELATALKALPRMSGQQIVIEGFTDSRGSRDYNHELSEQRAAAVRDYLVSHGLDRDLFAVEGLGPERPVASNRTAEGRANNRRVEIVLPPGTFGAAATATQAPDEGRPAATPAPAPGQTQAPLPGQTQAPTPVEVPPSTAPAPAQQPGAPMQAEPRSTGPIP
jgi:outer membrane protein OmpA-like peptidoglycan-associated protein